MLQPRIEKPENMLKLDDSDYEWSFQKSDGEVLHFTDYKGQVVFLNFWASYCPSCIAEFASINNLYREYKNEVKFLLITSESPSKVHSFLQNEQYDIPFYLTYGNLPEKLDHHLIPATYIIDREGNLILHKVGSARWDGKRVKELLDNRLNP